MTAPDPETPPIHLLVDADACPVREEAVKVALRHGIKVTFVSNSFFRIESDPLVAVSYTHLTLPTIYSV